MALPPIPNADCDSRRWTESQAEPLHIRISVDEIARRLEIGRQAVYSMLEQGIIPAIRLGRRWIVTCHAYDQ